MFVCQLLADNESNGSDLFIIDNDEATKSASPRGYANSLVTRNIEDLVKHRKD